MPQYETDRFAILINTNEKYKTVVDYTGQALLDKNDVPTPYLGFLGWWDASCGNSPYYFPPFETVPVPNGVYQNFLFHHGTKGLQIYNPPVHDPMISAYRAKLEEKEQERLEKEKEERAAGVVGEETIIPEIPKELPVQGFHKCDYCQFRRKDIKEVNTHMMKAHANKKVTVA